MSGRRTEVNKHQIRWSLTKTHKDLSTRYWLLERACEPDQVPTRPGPGLIPRPEHQAPKPQSNRCCSPPPPPVLRTRTSHQPPRARHQAPRPDQATEDPGARHPRAGERRTPETRCASSKRTPNSPGAAPAAPRNQNPPAGFQPGRNTPNTPRGPVARTPRISRDQSPRKPGPPDRRGVFSLQSHTIIPDSEEHPLASSRAVPKDVLRWIRAYGELPGTISPQCFQPIATQSPQCIQRPSLFCCLECGEGF